MIIYEIINKINGKSYIGQHSSDKIDEYWGSGKLIKRAIKKYGVENFEKIILEKCYNKEELNEREKYWIKEKDTINTGYNLTEGGTGGDTSKFINYSDDWKNKQRDGAKKYWSKLSDEELKERSDKVKGDKNGMFGKNGYWKGKKIPKEIIEKQLESRRSYKQDGNPNWKGGVSVNKCLCGKDIKPNNQSCSSCLNRNGENNPFYGKKHSDETRKILSEKRMGKKPSNIKKIYIEGNIYDGIREASISTGIKETTIWYRIHSNNKKYETYKYLE